MAKDDCIEFDGEVVDTLPNTTFRVKLTCGNCPHFRQDAQKLHPHFDR
jgi:hypothetical protein